MAISVQYTLTGRGWAECRIEIGEQQVCITASYLSDALADLLDAFTVVLRGADESTASFAEEPGEYRWRLTRIPKSRLRVKIMFFEALWKDRPDSEGRLIFQAECRLRTLAGAVLASSQRVLELYGDEGYKEHWQREFPARSQLQLQEGLKYTAL